MSCMPPFRRTLLATELLDDRDLLGEDTLHPIAHGHLAVTDLADHLREAARLQARGLVAAVHRPVERDVTLDHDGAHGDGVDRTRRSALVPAVADRHGREPL